MKIKITLFFAIIILFITCNKNNENETKHNDSQENFNSSQQFIYTCNNSDSCSNNGKCLNLTHCQCNLGYITILNSEFNPHFFQCNYSKKSRTYAFLLSFFLGPLSMDCLYLGDNLLGMLKLTIPSALILIGVTFFVIGKTKDNIIYQVIGRVVEFIATLIIIIWWLIDWILIAANVKKDLNEIEMY